MTALVGNDLGDAVLAAVDAYIAGIPVDPLTGKRTFAPSRQDVERARWSAFVAYLVATGGGNHSLFLDGDATWTPASGGGGISAIANAGAAGVGVYDGLSGSTAQLRNIAAGSSKITIALDAPNKDVLVDIDTAVLFASPAFTASPTAPTQGPGDNSTKLATTAYVDTGLAGKAALSHTHPESDIAGLVADLALKAPLASPALTGSPTAPTQSASDNSAKLATTAYVDSAVALAVTGLLDFKGTTDCSGNPNYPSAVKGDVYIVSVAGKIGGASGTSVDVGDWYVATANNAGGTEGAVGASWGHIEHNLMGETATPLMNGTGAAGSGPKYSFGDHVHPSDTSRVPTTRNVNTTSPLAGGGALSSDLTLTIGYDAVSIVLSGGNLVRAALTGDVTASQGSNATTIADAAVSLAKIVDASAASVILGRGSAAGAGDFQEITLGASLVMSGTSLVRAAHTGDVTSAQDSNALAIAANAVTNAAIRQSAGLSIIGRSANSTGNVADITAGSDGDVLRRSGTTLGFGAIPESSVTGLPADLLALQPYARYEFTDNAPGSRTLARPANVQDATPITIVYFAAGGSGGSGSASNTTSTAGHTGGGGGGGGARLEWHGRVGDLTWPLAYSIGQGGTAPGTAGVSGAVAAADGIDGNVGGNTSVTGVGTAYGGGGGRRGIGAGTGGSGGGGGGSGSAGAVGAASTANASGGLPASQVLNTTQTATAGAGGAGVNSSNSNNIAWSEWGGAGGGGRTASSGANTPAGGTSLYGGAGRGCGGQVNSSSAAVAGSDGGSTGNISSSGGGGGAHGSAAKGSDGTGGNRYQGGYGGGGGSAAGGLGATGAFDGGKGGANGGGGGGGGACRNTSSGTASATSGNGGVGGDGAIYVIIG